MLELPVDRLDAHAIDAKLVSSPAEHKWNSRTSQKFKKDYRIYLYALQEEHCAYCENPIPTAFNDRGISAADSSRIDHVKPRSQRPDLRFTPANLVLSCQCAGSCDAEAHCDAAKEDDVLPIEPGPGCNDGWVMQTDGVIVAEHSSSERVRDLTETARVLNLNSPRLTGGRKAAAESLLAILHNDSIPVDAKPAAVEVLLSQLGGRNYLNTLLR